MLCFRKWYLRNMRLYLRFVHFVRHLLLVFFLFFSWTLVSSSMYVSDIFLCIYFLVLLFVDRYCTVWQGPRPCQTVDYRSMKKKILVKIDEKKKVNISFYCHSYLKGGEQSWESLLDDRRFYLLLLLVARISNKHPTCTPWPPTEQLGDTLPTLGAPHLCVNFLPASMWEWVRAT